MTFKEGDRVKLHVSRFKGSRLPAFRVGVVVSVKTAYGDCAVVRFDGSRGKPARIPFVLLEKE